MWRMPQGVDIVIASASKMRLRRVEKRFVAGSSFVGMLPIAPGAVRHSASAEAEQIEACPVRDHCADPRRIYASACSDGSLQVGSKETALFELLTEAASRLGRHRPSSDSGLRVESPAHADTGGGAALRNNHRFAQSRSVQVAQARPTHPAPGILSRRLHSGSPR